MVQPVIFRMGLKDSLFRMERKFTRVNEMNITGNMNQFWFSLAEVGNDVYENSSIKIPSLMFENVDLSGI